MPGSRCQLLGGICGGDIYKALEGCCVNTLLDDIQVSHANTGHRLKTLRLSVCLPHRAQSEPFLSLLPKKLSSFSLKTSSCSGLFTSFLETMFCGRWDRVLGEPQMLIKTLRSSHWWIGTQSTVCDKLRTLKRVLNVHYTPRPQYIYVYNYHFVQMYHGP